MPKSTHVRSANALRDRDCAHTGTLTDERVRELYRRSQDQKAARVRAEVYKLGLVVEEILAQGGD